MTVFVISRWCNQPSSFTGLREILFFKLSQINVNEISKFILQDVNLQVPIGRRAVGSAEYVTITDQTASTMPLDFCLVTVTNCCLKQLIENEFCECYRIRTFKFEPVTTSRNNITVIPIETVWVFSVSTSVCKVFYV